MKKVICLDDEDAQFLKDLKESKGVTSQAFITMAIREKIIKVKQEIKLQENVSNK